MASTLEVSTARRLAFIKYVFRRGEQQSFQPEPLGAVSLLAFHDSVELFLQLASEHVNRGKSSIGFMDYWNLIDDGLEEGRELTQRESMRRLSKARVALKHHGTLPSKMDVEAFRTSSKNFFEENCSLVFGVEFANVTLASFVEPTPARERLEKAQDYTEKGQYAEATTEASVALQMMVDDYEDRKRNPYGSSPFLFAERMSFLSSFHMGLNKTGAYSGDSNSRRIATFERKLAEFVDRTKSSIESMGNALKVIAMGIDYRRYSRFRMLAGEVARGMDGDYFPLGHPQDGVSKDEAQFCVDFVIEAAITLQEFDYTHPSGRA